MDFLPIYDRVLVKPMADEKSAGGLHIPTPEIGLNRGVAIRVGHGRYDGGIHIPMTVEPGHIVLYAEGSGKEIKLGGEKHLLLREIELFAIEGE